MPEIDGQELTQNEAKHAIIKRLLACRRVPWRLRRKVVRAALREPNILTEMVRTAQRMPYAAVDTLLISSFTWDETEDGANFWDQVHFVFGRAR